MDTRTPDKTLTRDDDLAVVITVDGQTTEGFLPRGVVAAAKVAVASGTYSEDEQWIQIASDGRDLDFQNQIDACMNKSGGLTLSLRAYYLDIDNSPPDAESEQDARKVGQIAQNLDAVARGEELSYVLRASVEASDSPRS